MRRFAETRERPVVIPIVVVAVHVHAALVEPAVERREAPLAFGVLPVRAIRTFVGEGGIVSVDLRERVRVGGFEAHEFVLRFELVITDEAVLVVGLRTGFEEVDGRLLPLAPGHRDDDVRVDILLATASAISSLDLPPTSEFTDVSNVLGVGIVFFLFKLGTKLFLQSFLIIHLNKINVKDFLE